MNVGVEDSAEAEDLVAVEAVVTALGEGAEVLEVPGVALDGDLVVLPLDIMAEDEVASSERTLVSCLRRPAPSRVKY